MAGIGDYIHLHTENYIKYGVSQRGQEKRASLAQAYKAQKQINLQRINSIPDVKQSVLNELSDRVKNNFPEGKDAAQEHLKTAIAEQKLSEHFKNYILSNVTGNLTR